MSQSRLGMLPRWVRWPWDAAKFLYDMVTSAVHADMPGMAKLMIPMGLYVAYQTVKDLSWYKIVPMLLMAFLGAVKVVLEARAKDGDDMSSWHTVKWEEDMSHYHTEDD